MMRLRTMLVVVAALALTVGAATASSSVTLDGSFCRTFKRPSTDTIRCPQNVDGNECGVMNFKGLGPADYVYKYGPSFEPSGQKGCFDIDGTFTITLQSDGSSIAGGTHRPLVRAWPLGRPEARL